MASDLTTGAISVNWHVMQFLLAVFIKFLLDLFSLFSYMTNHLGTSAKIISGLQAWINPAAPFPPH